MTLLHWPAMVTPPSSSRRSTVHHIYLRMMADAGNDHWEMLALWQRIKKMVGSESRYERIRHALQRKLPRR